MTTGFRQVLTGNHRESVLIRVKPIPGKKKARNPLVQKGYQEEIGNSEWIVAGVGPEILTRIYADSASHLV